MEIRLLILLRSVYGQIILDPGHILFVGGILFQVLDDVVNIDDGVDGEAEVAGDLGGSSQLGLALFLAVDHDEAGSDLGALQALQVLHGLTDCGAGGDDVLNDDDLFTSLGLVADENAAFAVVLGFLTVEEEGQVQAFLGQSDGNSDSDGNTLVSGAVQDGLRVCADLVSVSLGIELAQLADLVTGLDLTGVDEVGDAAAGLGDEIAELQDIGALQEFDKFSLVSVPD